MDINNMNIFVLEYIGDNISEYYIRKYLINKGISNVNDLQTESIKYVSAKNQAKFLNMLIDKDFFSEEEMSVIKRARNYKTTSHPKSCDIITYKYATGLEALIGYLDLVNKEERIDEIMNFILGN